MSDAAATRAGLVIVSTKPQMPRHYLPVFVTALLACSAATDSDIALVVATDRLHYSLVAPDSSAAVRFAFRNIGRRDVDVPRCGPYVGAFVDRRLNSQWTEIARYAVICPAVYDMSPVRLDPGEVGESGSILLRPGVYRLRIPFGFARQSPFERTAISNEFTIAHAP